MSPKLKTRLKWLARVVCVLLLLVLAGWVFAPAWLVVDSGAQTADAVVVLGGEPQTRPTRAAEVYHEIITEKQKAKSREQKLEMPTADHGPRTTDPFQLSAFSISALPLVVVSGNGDCQDVRRQMEARGVPNSVIKTECESRSTRENALLSVKLLRAHHATNVVLVTSWYHSRRALACFRQAAPEIQFHARPTACPPVGMRHPDSYIVKRVFQEYVKIVYYQIFYGVSSW